MLILIYPISYLPVLYLIFSYIAYISVNEMRYINTFNNDYWARCGVWCRSSSCCNPFQKVDRTRGGLEFWPDIFYSKLG